MHPRSAYMHVKGGCMCRSPACLVDCNPPGGMPYAGRPGRHQGALRVEVYAANCHDSFIFPLSVPYSVRSLRYIPGRVRTFRSSSQFTLDRPRPPAGCSLSGRIVFRLYISRPGPSGLLSFVLVNLPSIPPRPPLSSALRCVRLASIAPVTATYSHVCSESVGNFSVW